MNDNRILEVFGEGVTDIGTESTTPVEPTEGVVVILVSKLCNSPRNLRVKKKRYAFLQGKGTWQKVRFAKQQSFYNRSHGSVFVMDSEGNENDLNKAHSELQRGRNYRDHDGFPMAIGVAHSCVEAWLLCDEKAIRKAMKLASIPELPYEPEGLPAPNKRRKDNPTKVMLKKVCGAKSASDKYEIARQSNDMELLKSKCPMGFAPFADEIEERIAPLFDPETGDTK